MAEQGLDALVIAAPEDLNHANLRYLSGFTGTSGYLVVGADDATFLTDSRYVEQAANEVQGCRVLQHGSPYVDALADACRQAGPRIGFEAARVPVQMLEQWRSRLPEHEFVAADGMVEQMRAVKDASEVAKMRMVAKLAGAALADAFSSFMPGMSERKFAQLLSNAMLERGLDGNGFPSIVASGTRGSLPHARATDKSMVHGELVTIDYGGMLSGYRSDETVTVGIGPVEPKLREIYELVRESQAAGIAAARAGVHTSEVDRAAREVIQTSAYREWCFAYGIGHGVGLDIHEQPFSAYPGSGRVDTELLPGMVITVEPGIYIPGVGGVRIEDTLLITEDGNERMTVTPKEYRFL